MMVDSFLSISLHLFLPLNEVISCLVPFANSAALVIPVCVLLSSFDSIKFAIVYAGGQSAKSASCSTESLCASSSMYKAAGRKTIECTRFLVKPSLFSSHLLNGFRPLLSDGGS